MPALGLARARRTRLARELQVRRGSRASSSSSHARRLGRQLARRRRPAAARTRSPRRAARAPRGTASSRSRDQRAVALDVAAQVGERPRRGRTSASRTSSAVDDGRARRGTRRPGRASSRGRSRARSGRARGRPRSAAAARAGAARRATARGRASRAPARRRGRSRPRRRATRSRAGSQRARHAASSVAARRSAQRAQRRLRARRSGARDLDPPRERRLGVVGARGEVLVARVDPELAAGARLHRRGLAAVVDVRVRADEQPHVLEPQADLLQRALEVGASSRGASHAAVDEHDPVAGGERPGVAVRHAGPGQRQPQAPDARQHALAAPDLRPSRGLAHGRGTVPCARMAADARLSRDRRTSTRSRARDLDGRGGCWAPDGVDELVGQATVARARRACAAFFGELFAAMPDFALAVEDLIADGRPRRRALARRRARSPATADYQGIAPTGRPRRADAAWTCCTVARRADRAQRRLPRRARLRAPDRACCRAQGTRRRDRGAARVQREDARRRGRLAGTAAEPVADGVWRVRGGVPRRDERLPDRGRGRRRHGLRRRRARDGRRSRPPRARSAASTASCSATPRRPPRRRAGLAARRSSAIADDARRTPRATAACTTSTSSKLRAATRGRSTRMLLELWDGGPVDDRRHDRGGRRRQRLPRRAHPRATRPGMIALFRERDGLALTHRRLLHARRADRPDAARRACAARAFNLDTEQARASIRKLAELAPAARLARARRAAHRRRRRAARAAAASADGQAQPPPRRRSDARTRPSPRTRRPSGDVLVLRGAMTPATRREYADAVGGSPLSREDAWQRRGRVPLRAARGALGDRGHRADHAPEGAARPLPLRLARRARAGSATCCASTSPSTSPTSRPRERPDAGRLRPAALRLLPRGAAGPAGRRALDDARGAAAARAPGASCSSAARGRCCAPALPGQDEGVVGGRAATSTSTASRPPSCAEAEETDASLAIQAPENTTALAGVDPARHGPRRPRPRADPRGARCAGAGARRSGRRPAARPAGGHGHGRVRRLRARARRSSTATTRSPPGGELQRPPGAR